MYDVLEELNRNVDETQQGFADANRMLIEYNEGRHKFICVFFFVEGQDGHDIRGNGDTMEDARADAVAKFEPYKELLLNEFMEEMYVFFPRMNRSYLIGVNSYEGDAKL